MYRAWDTRLRVWRAVKILFPRFAHNPQVRRRFAGEAHAMARLVHDNLVRVYDVEDDGALPFLVMELVDGGTLHDWVLRYGIVSPRQAASAIQQIAAGVGAAHEAGIIHRDVKPQNVLISPSGLCKLTDFGVARQLDHEQTLDGVPLGTRGYMAPEQYRDASNVDARADIFGLGASLWTLLTGRLPPDVFDVANKPELLEMVPRPLRPVIRVCCAQQPNERLKRSDSLERALATATAQLPPDPADAVPLTAPLLDPPNIGDWIDFPEVRPVLERPGQQATPVTDHDYEQPSVTTDRPYGSQTPDWQRTSSYGGAGSWSSEPSPGDPPSERRVIPYTMPNVTGKATPLRDRSRMGDDDAVPDYIDQVDLQRSTPVRGGATPAGLPTQRAAKEIVAVGAPAPTITPTPAPAPQAMAPPPVVPPELLPSTTGGSPVIVPSHAPAPARSHPTPGAVLPRHTEPPALSRGDEQRANVTAVISAGGIALVALMMVFTLLVTTSWLEGARDAVSESRAKVHLGLQDIGPSLSSVRAENKDQLAEAFLEYRERRIAGEPARINAALRLLDQLQLAVPDSPSMLERADDIGARARRLRAVRDHYEADLSEWHRRSSGFPGNVVVGLGMVSPPPEAQAWR